MKKEKIMFIKPVIETDACWDPIRTTTYLGTWYLASQLKGLGYGVKMMDETLRNGGFHKKTLFTRTIKGNNVTEVALDISYKEYQKVKMADFNQLSSVDFTEKYSAYRKDGSISRVMVRTGNALEETLKVIADEQPQMIGIPLIATANYVPAVTLGKAIKEKFPTIKIIYGGRHITAEADKFLEDNPWVDHVVTGDAISIIGDVVNGKLSEKKIQGRTEAISEFPLLDPNLLEDNEFQTKPTYTYTTAGRKYVDFMFSKGCFGQCDFCVAGSKNLKVRNKLKSLKKKLGEIIKDNEDPKSVMDKIQEAESEAKNLKTSYSGLKKLRKQFKIFKQHGINEIVIQDDSFLNGGTELFKKRLDLLKEYGFYLQDNGGIEFEKLNDKITQILIDYNKHGEGRITALYIPFNPRSWNKDKSAAKSMTSAYPNQFNNLKRLREEGSIYILTTEIVGTPEQTKEIILNDIKIHQQMISGGYIDEAVTLSATLLPGTQWRENHKELLINKNDHAAQSLFTVDHEVKTIKGGPKKLEELIVTRTKKLNEVQISHAWGTAFPNEETTT